MRAVRPLRSPTPIARAGRPSRGPALFCRLDVQGEAGLGEGDRRNFFLKWAFGVAKENKTVRVQSLSGSYGQLTVRGWIWWDTGASGLRWWLVEDESRAVEKAVYLTEWSCIHLHIYKRISNFCRPLACIGIKKMPHLLVGGDSDEC